MTAWWKAADRSNGLSKVTKNHTMEEKTFDFSEVPASWQLCFNRDCPRCEGCLRFVAGRHVPADHEWGPA